jgi:F-type H+-transporting ATPase subunit alpha
VISITDGQIYLEPDLFNSGVRPAINVGISVSRVGSSAQVPAMKKVTGTLRIDLAQFRALEAFALFSSDLDKASRAQLDRGQRMVELLKQDQYEPLPVERQVVSIWSGSNGFLDGVPVADVRRFERELLDFMESSHPEILEHIRDKGTLPDDVEAQLREAVTEFSRRFRTSEGKSVTPPQDRAEPMEPGEEGQESVRTYRRDTPDEVAEKSGPAGREASGTP